MNGTIILDFMDDPLSGVTLMEQLLHQDWVEAEPRHRHVNFGPATHRRQMVTMLAQELLSSNPASVIFNLPPTSPLAAQIAVVGTALLGALPQCVHLLYPSETAERDSASPYRLVGMLPLEAAERMGQQARSFANVGGGARTIVNLSAKPHRTISSNMNELHLPLHEHNSVASQMSSHASKLSVKDWRSALVILPRSSSIAVLALSFLRGLTGKWPNLLVDDNSSGDRVVLLESLYKQATSRSQNANENDVRRNPFGWQVSSLVSQ